MQKITVLITKTRILTFHNVSFSTLDSTDFLGFGRKKNKKCIFLLDFEKTKNMEPSEIEFLRAPCFLFFENLKKMHFLFFLTPPNFVNISIFHILPRVLWDIVATSCMLPYKCHTYLKSLWSQLFGGISQHDAIYKISVEN